MKRTFTFLMASVGMMSLFLIPMIAFGQGGIVPCEGVLKNAEGKFVTDCDFDHLLVLAKNIMNFLIAVSIPLAAIAFAYAGFLFMTAGGNSGQVSKAKEIFTKVFIGFIFVLGAWLIVWTITTALLCNSTQSNDCGFYNLLGN